MERSAWDRRTYQPLSGRTLRLALALVRPFVERTPGVIPEVPFDDRLQRLAEVLSQADVLVSGHDLGDASNLGIDLHGHVVPPGHWSFRGQHAHRDLQ